MGLTVQKGDPLLPPEKKQWRGKKKKKIYSPSSKQTP